MKLTCVLVDDEPLAREGLANYVRDIDFLHLTGTCENPLDLLRILDQQPVDLVFLDIQMPKMSGIDFLKMVQKPPLVILTTAYPSFALEGFQLNVLDYLLKPITFDRFFKSASKARDYHRLVTKATSASQPKEESEADYFFIKCGNKYEKIVVNDILFIEGLQNYVTIYTQKARYVTMLYLKNIEQDLNHKLFIRVHKSYIVAINKIDGIEGNELSIQTHRIPISRNYREQVLNDVLTDKVLKKK
ncbi:LytR/AlgR family response regulator transcription factor [Spirosoma radiotolerans]|uniref:Chemotaxis protein CheY n=1 Tax=Spirosoma radiotolerans TaxID=1379870 RepID=A0A0E3VAJ4_9BACT|nr:LytTR family DNA-binding domain-containing protein [Spirosoma radiotolerans]AKD58181.1 chemotaxis protein CheY [Spirosoma radiotolerans]